MKGSSRGLLLVATVLVTALWAMPPEAMAQGCAMCKTALEGDGGRMAQAFNWGILLLMAVPYVLFASVGGWVCYSYWRRREPRAGGRVLRLNPLRKEGVQ